MTEGQSVPRRWFNKVLDGNIGICIFNQLDRDKDLIARAMCRAVCRAWRILLGAPCGSPSYNYCVNYIVAQPDEQMILLSNWLPRIVDSWDKVQQTMAVHVSVEQDKPSALRLLLPLLATKDTRRRELAIAAIENSALRCIQEVIAPAHALYDRLDTLFVYVLVAGSFKLFKWFCRRFPRCGFTNIPFQKPAGKTFVQPAAKIKWMLSSGMWPSANNSFWRRWFDDAAGTHFDARKSEKTGEILYRPGLRHVSRESRNVAVAIVQHVWGKVPDPQICAFLCYRHAKNGHARNMQMHERLKRWCSCPKPPEASLIPPEVMLEHRKKRAREPAMSEEERVAAVRRIHADDDEEDIETLLARDDL